MSDKTLYELLEVSNDAAPECIRAAYLDLASRLASDGAGMSEEALRTERLALKEAYAVLSNFERRRKYDENLKVRRLQALASAYDPPRGFPPALTVILLGLVGGLYFYYDKVELAETARRAERHAAERRACEAAVHAEVERARIARGGGSTGESGHDGAVAAACAPTQAAR